MMRFQFSQTSARKLHTAHLDLQFVMRESLAYGIMDFAIIEGHRDKARQDRMHKIGKSRVRWPHGKHCNTPADAVDAVPYVNGKISWDWAHCCVLAGIIMAAAAKLGIPIRWGGNWDMDSEPITDQDFQDLVHYERIDP